ncbi:MAG: hypothetical protein U0269_06580 [Polyangiales bacterium]
MIDARTPARAWLLPFEDASALYRFDGATLDRSLPLGASALSPHAIDVESDTLCYALKSRAIVVRGALARDPLLCARINAPGEVTAVAIDGQHALVATDDPRHALGWSDLDSPERPVPAIDLRRDNATIRWLSVDDDQVLALALDKSRETARWLSFERPLSARKTSIRRAPVERAPLFFAPWQIGSDARRIALVSESSARGMRVDVYDRRALTLVDSLTVAWPRDQSRLAPTDGPAPQFQSLDLRDETLLVGFVHHGIAAVDCRAPRSDGALVAPTASTTATPSEPLVRAALLSAGEALTCAQQGPSRYRVERRSLVSD